MRNNTLILLNTLKNPYEEKMPKLFSNGVELLLSDELLLLFVCIVCKSLFILFYSRENLPYYVSKKKASNISKTIAFKKLVSLRKVFLIINEVVMDLNIDFYLLEYPY